MKRVLVLLVGMLLVFAGNSFASGFSVAEQSVSGLGNAFAGGSAAAEDASIVWHNPAGMTRIDGKQVAGGVHIIVPKAEFKNNGSTTVFGPALTGGNGGDAGGVVPIANAYYVETFDTGWSFGLGLNAPFGFATKYDRDWIGRYHGVESDVKTYNINPSVAHKLNDNFSFGFGFSAQYLDAKLTNAIDFGALDQLNAFGLGAGALGLTPQADDGFTEAEGDSWGYGFNFGFLYEIDDAKRIGFSYRSKIEHEVEGDVTWSSLPAAIQGGLVPLGFFTNGGVKVDIDLPASASLSYFQDVNDKLSVMADISWTEWSVLDRLVLDYADNTPNGVTDFKWDDSMRYAVGMTYRYSEKSKLRAGIAFDESPIPNDEMRNVRVPGDDRTWFALGGSHAFSEALSLDAAYVYVMTDDPTINKSDPLSTENNTRGFLKCEYDASVNIVSIQLNYNF